MRANPEMTISRPIPEDDELQSTISEMRATLVSNGMVWAEFEKDELRLVARGWKTGPEKSEMPMIEVKQPCCEWWAKAHESGTDSEGFQSLIGDDDDDDYRSIGVDLPPVKFCPWCGVSKQPASSARGAQ